MENQELDLLTIDRDEELYTGRKRWRKFVWAFFTLSILFVSAFLLYRLGIIGTRTKVVVATASRVFPSEVFSVFHASGYVVAQRKAAVASKATGRLAYLGVEEGSKVKKGDVIAILEKKDLEAAVDKARADLESAKSKLRFDEAEKEDALKQYRRYRVLIKRDVVTQSAYDAVVARYQKSVAAVKANKSNIEAARAALKRAQATLDYAYVRAPFDGIVLKKFAEVGEVVAPFGSATNAKAAVVTLADIHSLMVEADVSESNIQEVRKGQPCEITLDAIPGKRFRGTVHMIVPTADRAKATITVKVKFMDHDSRIMPEMSARVAFLSKTLNPEESKARLAIPENSVLTLNGVPSVFKVVNHRLKRTQVELGKHLKDYIEIRSGLEEGDKFVINPSNSLKEGQKVKIAEF